MGRHHKALALVAVLGSLALLTACSTVRIPARARVNPAVEFSCARLAVLPFEGRNGESVAAMMQTSLGEAGRYQLVERQRIQDVIDEHGLQRQALFDPETAVEVGRLVGASHVLLGNVATYSAQSDRDRRKVMIIGLYEEDGHTKFGPHEEWRTVFSLRADVAVSFRIVDVETAEVVTSKYFSAGFGDDSYNAADLPTAGGKLADLSRRVCRRFTEWIAGGTETLRKRFLKPDSEVEASERHVERALQWIEAGDLEEAEDALLAAVESDPAHAAALYNLAVVLALRGRNGEALEYADKADELDPGNETIMREKVWIRGRLRR